MSSHSAKLVVTKKGKLMKYIKSARIAASNANLGNGLREYRLAQGLCAVPSCNNKHEYIGTWCKDHAPESLKK